MTKVKNSSDKNEGVLPFKLSIPLVRFALENGRKVIKYTLGIYHLVGFTKGKGHAKLLKIEKECGKYDPDILPDLMLANPDVVEEYEDIASKKTDIIYWTQNSLTIAK